MKKKVKNPKLKKLTLNRETLRNLGEREAVQAIAGATVACTAESLCKHNSCYC